MLNKLEIFFDSATTGMLIFEPEIDDEKPLSGEFQEILDALLQQPESEFHLSDYQILISEDGIDLPEEEFDLPFQAIFEKYQTKHFEIYDISTKPEE